MKHPFYLIIAVLTCAYLVMANWRGWTVLAAGSAKNWGTVGRGVYHK